MRRETFPLGVLDQDVVGFGEEKAVADHISQPVEACTKLHDVETRGKRRVDHRIAVVGLVGRSVGFQPNGSLEPDRAQALSDRREFGCLDLDGQRRLFPQPGRKLVRLDQVDASRRGMRHDLLARHRAASALDHAQRGIDLVGAVEQEIEAPDFLEAADGEPQRSRQVVRGLAGSDAAKHQPLRGGALRQGANGPRRRTSCSQADGHAGDDFLDGRCRQQVLHHA